MMEVKCKHCRKNLFNKECISLFTSHNEIKKNLTDVGCETNNFESCSYISVEKLPKWIEHIINQVKFLLNYIIKKKFYCIKK